MLDIPGLEPVDPKLLEEFERAMKEEVIPNIVETVARREQLANESRRWFINR